MERPLLLVKARLAAQVTKADMLAFLKGKMARWWIPDDVIFVDELPRFGSGKMHKLKLRKQFNAHVFPLDNEG